MGRYSEVLRSQHVTQGDTHVFDQSCVANRSCVNGQDALLHESADHRHVDYFQGLKRSREQGLTCNLPVDFTDSLTESLKLDPHVLELEQEVQANQATLGKAKRRVFRYRSSLKQNALLAYQDEWIRRRRESNILNRGKQPVTVVRGQDQLQSLCLLMSQRGRLVCLARVCLGMGRWYDRTTGICLPFVRTSALLRVTYCRHDLEK